MLDLFYVVKHGRNFLSVLKDNVFVPGIEKARYFTNLELAEAYIHKHWNINLKIYEISITEA